MHTDDSAYPTQPEIQPKDYSQVVIRGTITLVVLVPVTFIVSFFTMWYGPGDLSFLPLVPILGLAGLTFLAGLLFFARPATLQQLAHHPRLSSRLSPPIEGGIWCFWASFACMVVGGAMIFGEWWSRLSPLAATIVLLSLVLGSTFVRDRTLKYIRRRS